MNERVTLARDGAVAFIEFRRPERHNALDVATAEAFLERCREVERDNGVRAVVLAGQGASFGAGGDLAELQAGVRVRPATSSRRFTKRSRCSSRWMRLSSRGCAASSPAAA